MTDDFDPDDWGEPTARERRALRRSHRRHQARLRRQLGRRNYRRIRAANPGMTPVAIVDTGSLRYLLMFNTAPKGRP